MSDCASSLPRTLQVLQASMSPTGQATWSWLVGWLVLYMLWGARGAQALCANGTFDAMCVCLDDEACVTTAAFQRLNQTCLCKNGKDISPDNDSDPPNSTEVSLGGESRSIYFSGIGLSSLQPYVQVVAGVVSPAIALKNTSVLSLDILSGTQSMGSVQLISNGLLVNVTGLEELERVTGDIRIEGNSALEDLDGLSGLAALGGNLSIRFNDALGNVGGLRSLNEVQGWMWVDSNNAIKDISGLERLQKVNRGIFVQSNAGLIDISGLNRLLVANDYISIWFNNALEDISGINNLEQLNASLQISANGALQHVSGFNDLSEVNSDLEILENGFLFNSSTNATRMNITGFGNLRMVGGSFNVTHNNQLEHLSGFLNLARVGGNFNIRYNDRLVNISAFPALTRVGGWVRIRSNRALKHIDGFNNLTEVSRFLAIWSNGALEDINGFNRLHKLNSILSIRLNGALKHIDGFETLEEVNEFMLIRENNAITDISGFRNLNKLGSWIRIQGNNVLEDISGFENLAKVGGILNIESNGILRDISGFGALKEVNDGIEILANGEVLKFASRFPDQFPELIGNKEVLGGKNPDDGGNDTPRIGDNSMDPPEEVRVNDVQASSVLALISGFPNLLRVGGPLMIIGNPALVQIDGFNALANVTGSVKFESNDNLKSMNGIGNASSKIVFGGLFVNNNPSLTSLEGFGNLSNITGDLAIASNENLVNISGLQKLQQVGGTAWVEKNPSLKNISGLANLAVVNGNLTISQKESLLGVEIEFTALRGVGGDVHLNSINISRDAFSKLETVSGSLVVQHSHFGQLNGKRFESVERVGHSLQIVSNQFDNRTDGGNVDMFPVLMGICVDADSDVQCGLVIEGNSWFKSISKVSFSKLVTINGSLAITGNNGMLSIDGFQNLKILGNRNMLNATIRDSLVCFGGMSITSNPDLVSVMGFNALGTIHGVLVIFQNQMLIRIKLRELANVTTLTNIAANNASLVSFQALEPLPSTEDGCRLLNHLVPRVDSDMEDGPVFATMLVMDECDVERLLPTLVGSAIILLMVVVSLLVFRYLVLNFYHPHRQRISVDKMKDMFATHLLALADVLSDVGFIVTVFILWETKGRKMWSALFFIGCSSTVVLLVSQLYMIVGVYLGLNNRKIGGKAQAFDLNGRPQTLLEHLKGQQGFTKADQIILFPGLLFLDAEIVKHLPFGQRSSGENPCTFQGFPHRHFANVAFVAGMLEDLPQIVLQVLFMVIIEDADGWVITGTMASLTLSVADAMVKFVFPMMAKLYMSREPHLTREVAMRTPRQDGIMAASEGLDDPMARGSNLGHSEDTEGSTNLEVAMSILSIVSKQSSGARDMTGMANMES